MRRIKIFFTILALSIISFYLGYQYGKPRFFELNETVDVTGGNSWFVDSKKYILHGQQVAIAREKSYPNVMILSQGSFPLLLLEDEDDDGIPDSVVVRDAEGKVLALGLSENGQNFKDLYLTVSGTLGDDAVAYIDENVDGSYDRVFDESEK